MGNKTGVLMNKNLWILKFVFSFVTFIYLYYLIKNHGQLDDFILVIKNININKVALIITVLLLVLPNWFLESVKWRILISKIEPVDLKFSLTSIFKGLFFSLFTPNRIGEIPGRAIGMPQGKKRKTMLATSLGGFVQSAITILTGILAYIFLLNKYNFRFFSNEEVSISFIIILLILVLGLTSFFLFKKSKYLHFNKIKKYVSFINEYCKKDLIYINALSIMRYIIFISQFYIFLIIFDVNVSAIQAYSSIALTYLVIFLTPFLSITEAGIRGAASVACIGFFSSNIAGILLAGFALWLVNIIIPSVIGSILLLKRKK